jgi:hypothetical protein
MTINTGKKFFTILIIFIITAFSHINSQTPERGIITMTDLTGLFQLLSNIEDSIVRHEWEIVFNSFLSPEFTAPYKANERWKSVEWMSLVFYPEIKPANPQESLEIANSIKAIKLFISDIIVYKVPSCDFTVEIKGVRIIDFLTGKRYIPVDMMFCKKNDLWILQVQP